MQHNDGAFQNLRHLFDDFSCHNRVIYSGPEVFCTVFLQNFPNLAAVPVNILILYADAFQHLRSSPYPNPFRPGNSKVNCIHILCEIPVNFKPRPQFFRRVLGLEGCGVFVFGGFCSTQVVHGLFGVGKVFLLQGPLFGFGQALGLSCRGILRVNAQHFLGFGDDVFQHGLHLLHHLVDASGTACVLVRLLPLELSPPPHALLTVKDTAPGVGHQLFRCLLIAQALGGIIAHLGPDHLVNVLIAVLLGQVQQCMVLQGLGTLRIQCVIPVVVLVQHGRKNILRTVTKENAGCLCVHIGPDIRIRCPVRPIQHAFQHCIGARSLGVQTDDLAGHSILRAQGAAVVGHSLAAGTLSAQGTAQLLHLLGPGFPLPFAVKVCLLQHVPSGALFQHHVHVQAQGVLTSRQPQRLVKAVHVLHLAQTVHAGGCRCIGVRVQPAGHLLAQVLCCLFAHLPAPQLLLHPVHLLAFGGCFLQPNGLPQLCRADFHTFPGILHGLVLCFRTFHPWQQGPLFCVRRNPGGLLRVARHANGSPFKGSWRVSA